MRRPSDLRGSKTQFPFLAGTSLLAALAFSPVAHAQDEPNAGDVAAARALGQEGVRLADSGNCTEAINKLERSEKMFHAPTTLARLGECQVLAGKLVEGTENLNRVVRESLPATAPLAFAQAQERAKKILTVAKPKIAKLKIAVAAPADAQFSVKVDGETVPHANLNTNRPIDPGEHLVEVSAPGYRSASARVNLGEGSVDSVALTLEVDPNAVKSTPRTAPTARSQSEIVPPGADPAPKSRAPAYLTLGLGAAGIGVGTVFGVLAMNKKDDLANNCANKVCSSEQQSTIDSGKSLATISTIGFGVGVVGLGVGTYLLLSGGSSSSSTRAARITPIVGTDRVGLSGTF